MQWASAHAHHSLYPLKIHKKKEKRKSFPKTKVKRVMNEYITWRPTKTQSPTTNKTLSARCFDDTLLLCLSYALEIAFVEGESNLEWQTLHSIIPFFIIPKPIKSLTYKKTKPQIHLKSNPIPPNHTLIPLILIPNP